MGLSASQARLLSLTARHSDLEYQGQVINQRRLQISFQTDQIAEQYNNSLSNRILYANIDGGTNTERLSVENILGPFNTNPDAEQNGLGYLIFDRAGNPVGWQADPNNPGEVISDNPSDPGYVSPDQLEQGLRNGSYFFVDPTKLPVADPNDPNNSGNWWNMLPGGSAPDQQALMAANQNASVDWRTNTGVSDELDTSDDEAAEANYEYQTDLLHTEDQQLEIQLKDVDTQHKAVETEIDAVKKVIDKNIEMTFKTFNA